MRIATWNLNNRVGKVRFRPEAALASIALDVDVLVLTEFYPKQHEQSFRAVLADAGWIHQVMSTDTGAVANRVLIASRVSVEPLAIALPDFDAQFPSNIATAHLPSIGLSLVGVRVPMYKAETLPLLEKAWDWLEGTARLLVNRPALILGDLNVATNSPVSRRGNQFRNVLANGWKRADVMSGASFYGSSGVRSEIDHILGTRYCEFSDAEYVQSVGRVRLAGMPDAISDHAALACQVAVLGTADDLADGL